MATNTRNKLETAVKRMENALNQVNALDGEQNELTEAKRKANIALKSAVQLVVAVENDPQTELPLDDIVED